MYLGKYNKAAKYSNDQRNFHYAVSLSILIAELISKISKRAF